VKKLGRYRLTEMLGQGGMGDVYAAVVDGDSLPGSPARVCVKVMNRALSGNERAVELFLREARLAARLSHPNIVQIIELGREQGTYFIAMEMLDGLPWHDIAQRNWRHGKVLPLEVIVHACAQAAEALEYAHTLKDKDGKTVGMVHRDVSPDNLFLTTDGSTKVLDFGIAKAVSHDATRLTEKGELRGKLPYMPPEQVKTEDVDGAADVWALGITLFYLSTAQRPFDRDTPLAIMNAVLKEPAIAATSMNPAVPKAFSDVIMRCLQKAPQERWPTALAVRDALLGLLPGPVDPARAIELLSLSQSLEKGDRRPLSAQPSAPTYSWEKLKSPTASQSAAKRPALRTAAPQTDDGEQPKTPTAPAAPAAPAAQRPEDRLPSRKVVVRGATPQPKSVEQTTVSAPLLTADESGEQSIIDADSSGEEDSDDAAEDGFAEDARTVAETSALTAPRPRDELDPPTEALDELPPAESTVAMAMDLSMLRDPPPTGALDDGGTREIPLSEETAVAPDSLPKARSTTRSQAAAQEPAAPAAPAATPSTFSLSFLGVVKPLPVWVFGVAAFGLTVFFALFVAALFHLVAG